MNTVLTFLNQNWDRLQLRQEGDRDSLTSVMVTPRFRASAHLLFFVMAPGHTSPILVVKVPRIAGDNGRLNREVDNLNFAQAARAGGFDSIPRVVAYEDYHGNRLLVETALESQTMRPAVVRKRPEVCTNAGIEWLIEVHQATLSRENNRLDSFERLVREPLAYFENAFPVSDKERQLLEQTREVTSGLLQQEMPLVLEHGDFSSPNVLMSKQNQIGVVDWELAEPRGLPAIDLFFFLSYIAFAMRGARKTGDCVTALQEAFLGPEAWAIPHIVRYREALQISHRLLKPLFVLCWSRYVTSLVARLHEENGAGDQLRAETAEWLRANRYYALWRFSIKHLDEIAFA